MKKIYLTLGLSTLILGAQAQQRPAALMTAHPANTAVPNNQAAKTAATATLMPSTFNSGGCATNTANVVYYTAFGTQATAQYTTVGAGYTFGTNSTTITVSGFPVPIIQVSDKAAQKYNVAGNVTVTDVLVASAIAEGAGSINAVIYDENTTTKGPGTQLGSASAALSSLTTGYDAITFSSPVAVSAGNFFASIECPPMGGSNLDTLAILSTVAGCSSTDSLSWISNTYNPPVITGGWGSVNSQLGANLDLLIFPVVDIPTGVNSISKGNLTLMAAFPNPATNEVSVNFGLNNAGKVEIEVYDVTGKTVQTIKMDSEAGNNTSKLNVSTLSSGVYMYSVKSENAKIFSKFTIAK
jgi:hypothetical protein